jgi:hypothetical protein
MEQGAVRPNWRRAAGSGGGGGRVKMLQLHVHPGHCRCALYQGQGSGGSVGSFCGVINLGPVCFKFFVIF